jgi:NAD(P)-dependent dehydrogenase (short-subunit alcohol dehydrogenase family)
MKRSKADLLKRAKLSKLNRAGQPNEVAALIEFLMSSKSNYITGEVIPIDGGDWI